MELQNSNTKSLNTLVFFKINSWPRVSKLSSVNPKLVTPIPSNSSSLSFHLLLNFLFWIHSIHEKKHLWYYFNITQSKYFHSDGFSTHWNPWNTSTYCEPFPYYQSFRNLPQSQKLLKRFSKSSLSMQQPRPHNQLEPNHSLLH